MNRVQALLTLCVLLAAVGLAGAAVVAPALGDVPDARLVVADVEVTPEAPVPDETTTVEFAVENSVGSDTGVTVERVALQERDDETVHAEAEGVGALSVGDGVSLELSTAFEEAGVRDLEVVVEATGEDGEAVVVRRPVTVVVGGVDAAGVTDDVQVDARAVHPAELDEDEAVDVALGAGVGALLGDDDEDEELRTPLVRVEVANFGTATARDVVVEPAAGGDALPRLAVGDVDPGEAESVFVDAGAFDEPTTLAFEVGYTLGTERATSETTLEYRPNRGEVVLTDVDMTLEDGRLAITGNAANPGLGEVHGARVAVEDAAGVEPAYPARDYFVGTVPASEFVRFDLTAQVDDDNATTVPVTVAYLADGEPYEETVELEYAPREEADGEGGSRLSLSLVAVGVGAAVLLLGGGVGWRRWYRGGG